MPGAFGDVISVQLVPSMVIVNTFIFKYAPSTILLLVLGAHLLPLKTSINIDGEDGGMDDAGESTVGVYSYYGQSGTKRGFCIKLYSTSTKRTAELIFNRDEIRFREFVLGQGWFDKSVSLS